MVACHVCRAPLPASLTVNVAFRDGAIEYVEMMGKMKEMALTTTPEAQPAVAAAQVTARKSRKKKKKAAVPLNPAPVPEDPLLTSDEEYEPVTPCVECRSQIPISIALAGGFDRAMAILVREGILSRAAAEVTPRLASTLCRSVATVPAIRNHGDNPTPDMCNLKLLLKNAIGGWIFCGEVLSTKPSRYIRGDVAVFLKDEHGRECCLTVCGSTQLWPGATFCGSNLSIRPLGVCAVDFESDATMLVPIYPRDIVHVLTSSIADAQQLCQKIYLEDRRVCWGCDQAGGAHAACQRCRVAKYCSRSCQVADWPKHKKQCPGMLRALCSTASLTWCLQM